MWDVLQCVGSTACGFAGWALWDGRGNESAAARAGLLALAAWGGALALGALAALCGAARSSAPLLAAAFSLLALTAVAEAAAAWWGAAHRPQLRRALLDALDHTVRHEYGVLHTRTQLLDVIQQGVSLLPLLLTYSPHSDTHTAQWLSDLLLRSVSQVRSPHKTNMCVISK